MKKEDIRIIKKNIWMNEKEDAELKRKAQKASMTEAHFIRSLISGYHPPEAPGDEFFNDMEMLSKTCDKLEEALKNCKDSEIASKVNEEIAGVENLRRALMKKYLLGERRKL